MKVIYPWKSAGKDTLAWFLLTIQKSLEGPFTGIPRFRNFLAGRPPRHVPGSWVNPRARKRPVPGTHCATNIPGIERLATGPERMMRDFINGLIMVDNHGCWLIIFNNGIFIGISFGNQASRFGTFSSPFGLFSQLETSIYILMTPESNTWEFPRGKHPNIRPASESLNSAQLDEGVDWNQPAKFAVCSNQWLDSTRDYIRYVLNFIRRIFQICSEEIRRRVFTVFSLHVYHVFVLALGICFQVWTWETWYLRFGLGKDTRILIPNLQDDMRAIARASVMESQGLGNGSHVWCESYSPKMSQILGMYPPVNWLRYGKTTVSRSWFFAGTSMDVHIGAIIWPEAAPNLLYLSAPL